MKRFILSSLVLASLQAQAFDRNPWLSDSHWTMSHGNSGATAAVDIMGPTSAEKLGTPSFVYTDFINITLIPTPKYINGETAYWGSSSRKVYKLKINNGKIEKVSELFKDGVFNTTAVTTPTSGAYTLLSKENVFYTVQEKTIFAYMDQTSSASSGVKLRNKMILPIEDGDAIVGLNMTFNGFIAFATKKGKVGVIDRSLTVQPKIITLLDVNNQPVTISNSIATDPTGGIFVVTSKRMHRVQWDGSTLTDKLNGAWAADYEVDPDLCKTGSGGRLGEGSGTTPTIMGEGSEQFVVINDCAKVNNIVLFWKDAIPNTWQGIVKNTIHKDRRIAAQEPVNFGDQTRTSTYSEQSPLVNGNGVVVVSNDYSNKHLVETLVWPIRAGIDFLNLNPAVLAGFDNLSLMLVSGLKPIQPWGMQKFEWNSATRKLTSVWHHKSVDKVVSCPNGIPSMSIPANTIYCVGSNHDTSTLVSTLVGINQWTIEGIDWTTGKRTFRKFVGSLPRYNSFYSATEVAHDGGMIYGTINGVVYIPPKK